MKDLAPALILAEEPANWPAPPDFMSFSRLTETEKCPRQGGLRHATYPAIWMHKGYPPRVALRALLGQAVHVCVGQVCCLLAANGCSGIHDEQSSSVLRQAGGLSMLVREAMAAKLTPGAVVS